MSYPLRLPPELDAEARERCARLGISLNAFIAVALDAYLRSERGGGGKRRGGGEPKDSRGKVGGDRVAGAKPGQTFEGEGEDDGRDWRFFHSNPDGWPLFDPEWRHRWDAVGDDDRAAAAALYDEYWRAHEYPGGGKPPTGAEFCSTPY